ncbi:hypothetical protein CEXT_556651 [Caerostris extrusa]|uniref:Uncharacterized protein n=1 Tax=Caerostris extrusa TaxID=172846 RepID=A0AAV4S7U3_CAEEX|nr:hypothetical protein CEXT_556651 [Caerostris extrusa]
MNGLSENTFITSNMVNNYEIHHHRFIHIKNWNKTKSSCRIGELYPACSVFRSVLCNRVTVRKFVENSYVPTLKDPVPLLEHC